MGNMNSVALWWARPVLQLGIYTDYGGESNYVSRFEVPQMKSGFKGQAGVS